MCIQCVHKVWNPYIFNFYLLSKNKIANIVSIFYEIPNMSAYFKIKTILYWMVKVGFNKMAQVSIML